MVKELNKTRNEGFFLGVTLQKSMVKQLRRKFIEKSIRNTI